MCKDEATYLLKGGEPGISEWNRKVAAGRAHLDLDGVKLSAAGLQGAQLGGANLRRSELNWADRTGANLDGAKLCRANLDGLTCTGPAYAKLTSMIAVVPIRPAGEVMPPME